MNYYCSGELCTQKLFINTTKFTKIKETVMKNGKKNINPIEISDKDLEQITGGKELSDAQEKFKRTGAAELINRGDALITDAAQAQVVDKPE